ncbi:MAG TPA: hypothetical protein VKM93_05130 [Terriglobia bacterium]|nr:hypothetical protein [Terriglobia bacterium]
MVTLKVEGKQAPAGSVIRFFALTYLVSWTCFIAARNAIDGLRLPLLLLGTFAPSLVAVGLTAQAGKRAGVSALLSRMLDGRVALRWYLFAAGYMAAIKLGVALLYRAGHGSLAALRP